MQLSHWIQHWAAVGSLELSIPCGHTWARKGTPHCPEHRARAAHPGEVQITQVQLWMPSAHPGEALNALSTPRWSSGCPQHTQVQLSTPRWSSAHPGEAQDELSTARWGSGCSHRAPLSTLSSAPSQPSQSTDPLISAKGCVGRWLSVTEGTNTLQEEFQQFVYKTRSLSSSPTGRSFLSPWLNLSHATGKTFTMSSFNTSPFKLIISSLFINSCLYNKGTFLKIISKETGKGVGGCALESPQLLRAGSLRTGNTPQKDKVTRTHNVKIIMIYARM